MYNFVSIENCNYILLRNNNKYNFIVVKRDDTGQGLDEFLTFSVWLPKAQFF